MINRVSPVSVTTISRRAAERLRAGHVWVYRSDIEQAVEQEAGLTAVADYRGVPLGAALWSPSSQIALRMVSADPQLDESAWLKLFRLRLGEALRLRQRMLDDQNDSCPLGFK